MSDVQNGQAQQTAAPETAKKICKGCKNQIDAHLMVCPHCGKNLKPVYKKPWFWILIVLGLIVLLIVGCTAACGSVANNAVNSTTTKASDVGGSTSGSAQDSKKYDISDVQMVSKGYGLVSINGILKNNSGSDKSYVSVEYIIKDKDGNQITTAIASTSSLAKDATWKFEASCLKQIDPASVTYELSKVTGF
ncbi:MAG: hypothetical protein HUJ62_07915 [Streptococcus gallolyticus]|nr:hypothetical protein [Streptococcus gallolyticus]